MAAAILSCSNFPQITLHFSSPSHSVPRASRLRGKPQLSSLPHMTISGVSNSQYGRLSEGSGRFGYGGGKMYRRLGSCLVIPPPAGRKPKALIKFLGGAFIGAVPEVTYSYLIELLAEEGYLIISVPYNVTFDHEQVTREIYERFHACLNSILSTGLPDNGISAADIADLPYYSVGHSNGALLQVLTGSYFCEKIPKVVLVHLFVAPPGQYMSNWMSMSFLTKKKFVCVEGQCNHIV